MDRIVLTDLQGRRWRAEVPITKRERRRGLSGHDEIPPARAMFFPRCRSVHTFGMAFPIDVVLLDRALRVVAVVPMAPGRLLLPRRSVRHVLECAAGVDVCPGDRFIPSARGYTLSAAP